MLSFNDVYLDSNRKEMSVKKYRRQANIEKSYLYKQLEFINSILVNAKPKSISFKAYGDLYITFYYFVSNGLMQNDESNKLGLEIENINEIINHRLVLNNGENEFLKKHKYIYLKEKTFFLNCNGKIDNLDETKILYKKYAIRRKI